jgi:hypothetical protein
MALTKHNPYEAELTTVDKERREWRYPMNILNGTCSCRQW